jgi:hypothetical protein
LIQHSIPLLIRCPQPAKVLIAVVGDAARTPWLSLLRDLTAIAFPGAEITIHPGQAFPPRLQLKQSAGDGALRGVVAIAEVRLVEALAGLSAPAQRQLGTLLALAHEDTGTLRMPILEGPTGGPPKKHFYPDAEREFRL